MKFSSNPARAVLVTVCLLALGAVSVGLAAQEYFRSRASNARHDPKPDRPQLIFAVDGLSWDAFTEARRRGMFRRFQYSARNVAPYPSMSHPSWTEIIGTKRVFGARGNAHTIETRWFDLDQMTLADDPRQNFARQLSPYFYQRAFDYFFDPLTEPLTYFRGRKLFDRELREAESGILTGFTGDRYVAYIGGPDALAHTHKDEFWSYITRVDSMMERVADSLDARGKHAELVMVSDHGNSGNFVEGTPEQYLTPLSLDGAIQKAALVRSDSGHMTAPNQVSVVTLALASMIDVYFVDLSKRRDLARTALEEPGVDLVTWLEVQPNERYVVIRGRSGSEAHLRWRDNTYAYERIAGDPLGMPDSVASTAASPKWISDDVMRKVTIDGPYPDAPYRLVQSASKQVENAPDLIVSLRDGYCATGDLGKYVRMVRTHGALGARSSVGILASSTRPLPKAVRGNEVLSVIGTTPEALLTRVAAAQPHDEVALARQLSAGSGWIETGRSDASLDISFQRRARPIALSMDYFDFHVAADLFHSFFAKKDANDKAATSPMSGLLGTFAKANVVAGVTNNVDTLVDLVDSLDPSTMRTRLEDARARIRAIPELAPLADIGVGDGKPHLNGRGEPARRAAMALWTLPYFLDDALMAPEQDSIRDPRDLRFALDWHRELRREFLSHSSLTDTTTPHKLFDEVFAERKLRRTMEPVPTAMLYEPDLGDITVVYVPGIYTEVFDQEIWSRGLRSVHDKLGLRTLTIPVSGRCSSGINSDQIVQTLVDDTRRRLERGYAAPRYLLLGYSKGGVDATEALLRAPDLARRQIAGLVSIASPHLGTPVAERAGLRGDRLDLAVRTPKPAPCDSDGVTHSLWPATRNAFWAANAAQLAGLTRFFSVSFATDMADAHPWMKITKRIGEFNEPNDGIVSLTSSHFPAQLHATDLGTINGDHIAGRLASNFPQDAFLEAVVISVAELGGLDLGQRDRWIASVQKAEQAPRRSALSFWRRSGHDGTRIAAFASSTRPADPVPGGSSGWTPERTFSASRVKDVARNPIRQVSLMARPNGITFHCDQKDMLEFRREYEFYYDSDNGGSEDDGVNGFSIAPSADSNGQRACHFATQKTAIKMTTVSFQFRPVDFPMLRLHARVEKAPVTIDPGKGRKGANDAPLKLWLVLKDMRPEAHGRTLMFGYTWTGRNSNGITPPAGTLIEAVSSKRNLVFSTLPEAWLIAIGSGTAADARWQTVQQDVGADLARAYPGIPLDKLKVVGITLQSDSDDSHSRSDVWMDALSFLPRPGHGSGSQGVGTQATMTK